MKNYVELDDEVMKLRAPKHIWIRLVNGVIVEVFTNHQAMNACEDQEHIEAYVLDE